MTSKLPEGLVLTRTTPTFDNDTVPAGLLAAHRVAEGVWGRLVVHSGAVVFRFEDGSDHRKDSSTVEAGGHMVIPPGEPHHVELDRPATFAVEFYRAPSTDNGPQGLESTGLE